MPPESLEGTRSHLCGGKLACCSSLLTSLGELIILSESSVLQVENSFMRTVLPKLWVGSEIRDLETGYKLCGSGPRGLQSKAFRSSRSHVPQDLQHMHHRCLQAGKPGGAWTQAPGTSSRSAEGVRSPSQGPSQVDQHSRWAGIAASGKSTWSQLYLILSEMEAVWLPVTHVLALPLAGRPVTVTPVYCEP